MTPSRRDHYRESDSEQETMLRNNEMNSRMIGQSPIKIGQELDHGVPPESEKSHSSRIKSPEVIVMK